MRSQRVLSLLLFGAQGPGRPANVMLQSFVPKRVEVSGQSTLGSVGE